ncbi:hypothetical protein KR084_008833 [Drosophila pseudotakahashii]|nr:hypothetical protein KR084_008833 [Drosophila pseudotakahashii]
MTNSVVAFALCWFTFCVISPFQCNSFILNSEEQRVYDQLRQQNCGLLNGFPIPIQNLSNDGLVSLVSQPWMVLIYAEKHMDSCRCGGALISKTFVLTSAHCLAFCPSSTEFKVRLGEQNLIATKDGEFVAKHQIPHNKFLYSKLANDIALLRLNRKVVFKDHIRPICLPLTTDLREFTYITGKSYNAIRWKEIDRFNDSSTLTNHIVITEKCPVDTHESFLCTTEDTACKENSGGPLIWKENYFGTIRQVFFGIASHGKGPCGPLQTAYYTNLSAFMPWILKTIAKYAAL